MIKQVSFDVWNTLVEANPHYATARTMAIAKAVGIADLAHVRKMYTAVKTKIDTDAELFGIGPSTDACWNMLLTSLDADVELASSLRHETEQLFFEHLPVIHPAVYDFFESIRQQGMEISIASNSNFISGQCMYKYLTEELGTMSYGVFSDLVGHSKPSPDFFNVVIRHSKFKPGEILHIGDNEICDGHGAVAAQLAYRHVKGPYEIFKQGTAAINEHNN